MIKDLALLDKTEITAKTALGEATLVIHKSPDGYACAVWSGGKCLGHKKIGAKANAFSKAAVLGPLLVVAKDAVKATAEQYPEGLEIRINVEHNGKTHAVNGKIPLDGNQINQFMSLVDWVKQVNAGVNAGK